MKHYMMVAAMASTALVEMDAHASEALAKAKNCMACHAANTKLVGPALKDIAAKYANDKNAEASLALKVMKGSSGVWGPIPMPPNPQVSEAEARTLVRWMLGRK